MACGTSHVWSGECSWFCCGGGWGPCGSAGTGACGTCQSSRHMAAWPNASAACWDVTNPGACGENMPRRGFRILRYAGRYEPGTGPRPVSVLFALDAEATRADPRGAVVRVSVVDDETGRVLPDPQLLVPAETPVPAG